MTTAASGSFVDSAQALAVLAVLDSPVGRPMPGSFVTALIQAAAKADPLNMGRLVEAFPEYCTAVALWKYHPDGRTHLIRLAAQPDGVIQLVNTAQMTEISPAGSARSDQSRDQEPCPICGMPAPYVCVHDVTKYHQARQAALPGVEDGGA